MVPTSMVPIEDAIFNAAVREGLFEDVTFE